MERGAPILEAIVPERPPDGEKPKILVVLVIYKVRVQDSPTYQSLLDAGLLGVSVSHFAVLVYDNSPQMQVSITLDAPRLQYIHDPANGGLAAAYNQALKVAITGGFEWLLLLDQDTTLPAKYFSAVCDAAAELAGDHTVSAIVPKVKSGEKLVSPSEVLPGWRLRPIPSGHGGLCDLKLTAINSGTVIRTSFVCQLGGFNSDFWLDCLDHWLFTALHAAKKRLYVLDAVITHDLSVLDYNNNISITRYQNILRAEGLFFSKYQGRAEMTVYLLRLVFRATKQFALVRNKKIALMTLRHLFGLLAASPHVTTIS